MKATYLFFALVAGLIACNKNQEQTPAPEEETVEVSYMSDAEIDSSADNLDSLASGGRMAAGATATSQYFQCKTDDGDLMTPTFTINDYYYGDTRPAQSIIDNWKSEPATSTHGALKVTRSTPKGTQLVKSKSLKHGWHVVTEGNGNSNGDPFEVKPGVKGLIELSWQSSPNYNEENALIRVNYKYVGKMAGADRYDNYTASQQEGKTFAQWTGNNTIDNIDWESVSSTYSLQPMASATVAGTFKSIAYRVPFKFKGYVFTADGGHNPRGADVDLIGRKGVTLTYKKVKTTN